MMFLQVYARSNVRWSSSSKTISGDAATLVLLSEPTTFSFGFEEKDDPAGGRGPLFSACPAGVTQPLKPRDERRARANSSSASSPTNAASLLLRAEGVRDEDVDEAP